MFERVFALLVTCVAASQLVAAEPLTEDSQKQVILHLVGQLDDEHYQTRDAAGKRLLSYGDAATEPLFLAVRSGSLERANRALQLLAQLAHPKDPDIEDPAMKSLEEVAAMRITSKSALAAKCLREVIVQRSDIAKSKLREAGVSIAFGSLVIDAKAGLKMMHVRVPVNFTGTADDLRWLAWITDVEYLVAGGPKVDGAMLRQIARMPNLHSIALHRAPNLRSEDLSELNRLSFIQHLELMYMNLGEPLVASLNSLKKLQSIRLFGVPLDDETLGRIADNQPTVLDGYSAFGAFLGVSCSSFLAECVVEGVSENSAAQAAGLTPGDVIIQLGAFPVRNYPSLRAAIAQFPVDQPIEIQLWRLINAEKQLIKLTVTLRGTEP